MPLNLRDLRDFKDFKDTLKNYNFTFTPLLSFCMWSRAVIT